MLQHLTDLQAVFTHHLAAADSNKLFVQFIGYRSPPMLHGGE